MPQLCQHPARQIAPSQIFRLTFGDCGCDMFREIDTGCSKQIVVIIRDREVTLRDQASKAVNRQ
ncbi:hypothetical protein D3C76_1508280 [compost metagenome]